APDTSPLSLHDALPISTGGPAILDCRALGDWLSLRAEPVSWRRYPNHGPNSERRRYLTRLGGECEIVLRTCIVAGGFTRPTGDRSEEHTSELQSLAYLV